jgi:hypothetical protein
MILAVNVPRVECSRFVRWPVEITGTSKLAWVAQVFMM